MKVLFVMRHSGYVRNFESTLRLLADRGHTVHLAFQKGGTHWLLDPLDVAQQLSVEYPRVSRSMVSVREDAWGHAAQECRVTLDYLRYLEPEYRDASKLRARAEQGVPEHFLSRAKRGPFSSAAGRSLMAGGLRALERSVPTDPGIDAFLDANRPDVLAVTPLIEPGAPQSEYLRSARALGIRTALCVASWDNLTNKGLIHGAVDLVTVWNDAMKREAVELHGVPAGRVVVTGAQPFDQWFDWTPSTTREAFCQRVGLPPTRPYLLYLCSSRFIAPEESRFVRAWLAALRQAPSPALRDASVLIRPHPQNSEQWRDFDAAGLGAVTVWPQGGATPSHQVGKADYFDSIYHAAAAVGVNTTAEIESAIVGRRVFTVTAPDFRDTQGGTLHFEHLHRADGGLVEAAASFDEHFAQLSDVFGPGGATSDRCRRFVGTFVRPHGVDVPATPRLVDALEALARTAAPAPTRPAWWARPVRSLIRARGERLQREALVVREAKAARARRKGQPEPVGEPSEGRSQPTAPRTWQELAQALRALDSSDRSRLLPSVVDIWPSEQLAEQLRPERVELADAAVRVRVASAADRTQIEACASDGVTGEWVRRWIQPADVVYDIGAGAGLWALAAAMRPGGVARVIAFESAPAALSALFANIELNDAAASVTAVPFAWCEPHGPTAGNLDETAARLELPSPCHVRFAGGASVAVLAGAGRLLASPTLRSILVESSADEGDAVVTVLARHGLVLDAQADVRGSNDGRLPWRAVFVRQPVPMGAPRESGRTT